MVLVVIKALDMLEFVAQDQERTFSLTEISEGLQIHQATCANILKTLVGKQYLEHVGRKKGYRLGPMAYNLTNNLAYSQNLVSAARDEMEELTRRVNETCILGIIRNHKRYIVHLVNSDQDLQVRSRTERNIYETASGRVLLAFLSDKERAALIQVVGLPADDVWPEAATPEGLERSLAAIQREELSVTHSRSHIIGLAVPVRRGQQVVASISIFLPEIRCPQSKKQELIDALRETAARIDRRLGAM
ncbi:IclR family transcriptional regulator [Larkinella soli]|uniref:IclR family transcriptional regulator n=1 Tax=Larkinella soli TaxID=1770527 RepID=UPI000FFB5B46|nr:IclR family transcriptional regulator [Larkinella soli]